MGFNLLADCKILERGRIIDIFGLMQQPLTTSWFKQIKGVEYGYKPPCLVSDVTGDQWHPTSLAGGQLRVDGMSSARILIF